MNYDPASVHSLRDEYKTLAESLANAGAHEQNFDWSDVMDSLHAQSDWTASGAEHVTVLARQYGSFILRNALALALALEIEDGELGL